MSEKIYFHIDNQDFLPVGVKFEKINNIDKHENDTLEHVMIQDLLDYYHKDDANVLVSVIKDKLKSGGLLSIQSLDLRQLCIAATFDEISTDFIKDVLYPNKKSIRIINDITNLLQQMGFEIETKKYINIFEYYVLAKKI